MSEPKKFPFITNAWQEYRRHFSSLFGLSFAFLVVIIVIVVIGLVFPFSLIITMPFVIIPFCFAYVVSLTQIVANHPMAFNEFYRYLLPGMNPFIRRLIRPYMMLLKGALVSFLMLFITTLIANLLAPSFNPALAQVFENLATLTLTSSDANDLLAFIDNNATVLDPFFTIVMGITSLSFLVYLFLAISDKIPALFLLLELPTAFPELGRIHRQIMKERRRMRISIIVKNQWPTFLLLLIGAVIGALVGFILKQGAIITSLLALLGALLAMGPSLPHYFLILAMIYQTFESDYFRYAKQEIAAFLTQIDAIDQLSAEQKEELKKALQKHLDDEHDDGIPQDDQEQSK